MSLEKLYEQLGSSTDKKLEDTSGASKSSSAPPVEQWNPPYCGEIDLQIHANGDWYYGGTIFKRLALVKLFASVMRKEETAQGDHYFLVTPVEKVKITVEDAPFILSQWRWLDEQQSVMEVETTLGDCFVLDSERQFSFAEDGSIYVNIRGNLQAKVHRNVYYQWAELATSVASDDASVQQEDTELFFISAGYKFSLGFY